MSKNLKISKADLNDAAVIAEFNRNMAKETENFELHKDVILNGVKNLIQQPELGFYIVAKIENQICGCLMITKEWSDWRNGLIWWVQSVYIHPDYRRQGIFRKMYRFISENAKERGIIGLRLYVEHTNSIAQKTYTDLGMKKCNYHIYEQFF
ncbi:MAG: GNAT family N-acetyltransferase [Calditrichaceae bacterium]|nr:GNAT family N-acetyltransferase [Calditrichaceae bacterium]